MTKVVSPTVPVPLDRKRAQNGEDFAAEVLANGAGVEAWVNGHTEGRDYVDADEVTPNPAPRNQHGRFGHDHSGGLYGKPLFRTIASFWVERGDRHSNEWAGQDASEEAFRFASGLTIPPSGRKVWETRPFFIYPPNCDPGPLGAYNVLGVALGLDVLSTTLSASDTVTLRFRNLAPSLIGSPVEFDMSTPNAVGDRYIESDGTTRVPMLPGRPNLVTLEIDVETVASGSTRNITIQLFALEFGVFG